uniref:Borealin C-terminal domain-containing protein n=1 Tax=Clastoptera arizonana TaxID=38151 RepID=A0A1B6CSM4_9HEMI
MARKRSSRYRMQKESIQNNQRSLQSCSGSQSFLEFQNLVTSSPKQLIAKKEFTYDDYKSEYLRAKKEFKKDHEDKILQVKDLMNTLKLSISADFAKTTLGSKTTLVPQEFNISSTVDETFLLPLQSNENSDHLFKKPSSNRPKRTLNKPLSSTKFKTPNPASQLRPNFSALTITPKINPNTPLNIMRRPKQGEVAVSMTGSPLLVSNIAHDELPHVTVPISDGRVFSIMPNPGVAPENFPTLDEQTKQYLKTLQEHLVQYCK